MEQNKAEDYVVFINGTFMKNFVIWSVILAALLYMTLTYEFLFYPGIAFAGYLASNLMMLLVTGLRIPGYQLALGKYGVDMEARKSMIANYERIKANKPFAISTSKHLISVGVGILCSGLVYLTVITG